MILGIEGSPRKAGNSHNVLKILGKQFQAANIPFMNAHLRDYQYMPCVGCEKCRRDKICTQFNDGMSLLYPQIKESQALVMVSPVHNYNVTAWMKSFIDRLYCFYDFTDSRPRDWSSRLAGQNRKAILVAIAEQSDMRDLGMTLDAMRMPLEALGYEIVSELPILKLFDRGAISNHPELIAQVQDSGQKLIDSLS